MLTNMNAPRGLRCPGLRDWQARGRVNVIGALLAGVLLSIGLTASNVDAEMFNLWLGQDLLPKLPPDAAPVPDNASFNKRSDTEKLIAGAGHTLEYLPPCSPDLNKIEPIRAQAKAARRRTGQSVAELFSCKSGIKIES